MNRYRIYPDGEIYHEDHYKELDSEPYYDDYFEVIIPDAIDAFIAFCCGFYWKSTFR